MSKITVTLAATVAVAAFFASNVALADGLSRQQVKDQLVQAWADGTVSIASAGADGNGLPLFHVKTTAVDVKAPVVVAQKAEQVSKQ